MTNLIVLNREVIINLEESIRSRKSIQNKNKEIILNVALSLNKELLDENKISYKMFKYTEENLLKELKSQSSM